MCYERGKLFLLLKFSIIKRCASISTHRSNKHVCVFCAPSQVLFSINVSGGVELSSFSSSFQRNNPLNGGQVHVPNAIYILHFEGETTFYPYIQFG